MEACCAPRAKTCPQSTPVSRAARSIFDLICSAAARICTPNQKLFVPITSPERTHINPPKGTVRPRHEWRTEIVRSAADIAH